MFLSSRPYDKELLTNNTSSAVMHSMSAMPENQHKSVEVGPPWGEIGICRKSVHTLCVFFFCITLVFVFFQRVTDL